MLYIIQNDLMLRAASRLGNFEKVKELINSGAHPESCDGVRDILPVRRMYARNYVCCKTYIQLEGE